MTPFNTVISINCKFDQVSGFRYTDTPAVVVLKAVDVKGKVYKLEPYYTNRSTVECITDTKELHSNPFWCKAGSVWHY